MNNKRVCSLIFVTALMLLCVFLCNIKPYTQKQHNGGVPNHLDPFVYIHKKGRVKVKLINSLWHKYHFEAWPCVEVTGPSDSITPYIVFNVTNGDSFQHFFQDLLYVIHSHKHMLSNCVLIVPNYAHAQYVLSLLSIENDILQVPYDSEIHVEGNVTIVNWKKSNGIEGGSEWINMNNIVFPYRQSLFQVLQPSVEGNKIIFVKRNKGRPRAWNSETAKSIEYLLGNICNTSNLELVLFEPDELDMSDLYVFKDCIHLFSTALCVVSVHGGANYHIFFCPKSAAFIEVTMPNSFYCARFAWFIDAANIKYKEIVAKSGNHTSEESVEVDPQAICDSVCDLIGCKNQT